MPKVSEDVAEGRYIVGRFLGIKEPSKWTPPGESREVDVPPKLGLSVDDREIAVRIGSLSDVGPIVDGAKKGEKIMVAVRTFPGRDGKGLRDVWAGLDDDGPQGWT